MSGFYARRYGGAARFIIHHLAGELLVSRSAIAWRLVKLGLDRSKGVPPI